MRIAITGLGKMGSQIAKKLYEDGHIVIAHNRSSASIDEMKTLGMIPAYTKKEVVELFNKEQIIIWMMVPSDVVDVELDDWLKIIPKGSILIDGGNSDFRLTKKRAEKVLEKGSILMDVGTSGGIWGYKNGFSMMVGGDKETFKEIEDILKTLSKPEGAYYHFGESGAGHFVKMTHNAIEYGMMESLAEGYRILKEGPYKNIDLYHAGDVWQHHSVVTSWLNELTRDALKENGELKGIEGSVTESGEARWALETAKSLNIETPSIQAAFDVRLASQKGNVNFATKLLALMRNAFGGHKINGK
ncbi:6-phosphogluconate dehydrogenase [Candidatus Nomurabacteria bacterium CG_4_10_14_0_2_um_filter_30_12]|uniref:6-phosphogluconate dehydrogenase n=2 Tax=Candidatus Nomuraibacteriota TaxID=1752729 RepID=A0A2J0MG07_9BACT|nr:MAG: 6-phosphogluconate dehydrogenase [Candidatus Nomurabacteria bacterium CG10_big_fil_rev_8_21_14_0_10_03_31_7]PIZ87345.1 MAG: 6-phosphogluconate dehydrogenase [Candidatus Nomurabacteria bacterium CG_4_10_14_0_2_um_filter_30_12]